MCDFLVLKIIIVIFEILLYRKLVTCIEKEQLFGWDFQLQF